jgi:hypothetical protein
VRVWEKRVMARVSVKTELFQNHQRKNERPPKVTGYQKKLGGMGKERERGLGRYSWNKSFRNEGGEVMQ